MEKTLYLINVFELIAAVLGTIYFKKYFSSTEKYFFYYLWLTFFIDALGAFFGTFLKMKISWIYILFVFFSFLFYFYWYYTILKKKLFKKIVIFFSIVFTIYAVINFLTLSWTDLYHRQTIIFGSFIIIVVSLFYFSELLNSDKVLNIKNELRFWITTGLLLFYVGVFPLMVFYEQFEKNYITAHILFIVMNAILYMCYSLGFIWNKKK